MKPRNPKKEPVKISPYSKIEETQTHLMSKNTKFWKHLIKNPSAPKIQNLQNKKLGANRFFKYYSESSLFSILWFCNACHKKSRDKKCICISSILSHFSLTYITPKKKVQKYNILRLYIYQTTANKIRKKYIKNLQMAQTTPDASFGPVLVVAKFLTHLVP